jgi:hypothetical protein
LQNENKHLHTILETYKQRFDQIQVQQQNLSHHQAPYVPDLKKAVFKEITSFQNLPNND